MKCSLWTDHNNSDISAYAKKVKAVYADRLAKERERVKIATGDTRDDFKYAQAEKVHRQGHINVFVTFKGKKYGPVMQMSGALDGDDNKLTVLIRADDGKYWKLWFWINDIKKA